MVEFNPKVHYLGSLCGRGHEEPGSPFKSRRYLYRGNCTMCMRITQAKKNPEKCRAYKRKAYAENPEKYRAISRKYRENNPEKCRARSKKYRENNPEKCSARTMLNYHYGDLIKDLRERGETEILAEFMRKAALEIQLRRGLFAWRRLNAKIKRGELTK